MSPTWKASMGHFPGQCAIGAWRTQIHTPVIVAHPATVKPWIVDLKIILLSFFSFSLKHRFREIFKWNEVSRSAIDGSSDSLTPYIQRIMAWSFPHNLCRTSNDIGQVFMVCSNELRTTETNRQPRILKGTISYLHFLKRAPIYGTNILITSSSGTGIIRGQLNNFLP